MSLSNTVCSKPPIPTAVPMSAPLIGPVQTPVPITLPLETTPMSKYTIYYLNIIQTYIKHIYNPIFMRLVSKNLIGYKYHHWASHLGRMKVRQVDQMSRAKNMLQHSMEPLEVCQVTHDAKPSHKDDEDGNVCCFKELNSNFYIGADGTSGSLFCIFFPQVVYDVFFLVHLWDIKGNQS